MGVGSHVFYTLVLVPGLILGTSTDIHLYIIKAFWKVGGFEITYKEIEDNDQGVGLEAFLVLEASLDICQTFQVWRPFIQMKDSLEPRVGFPRALKLGGNLQDWLFSPCQLLDVIIREIIVVTFFFKKKLLMGTWQWWCTLLILALGRQRKVHLCVQGQLVLHSSSRLGKATQRNTVSKKERIINGVSDLFCQWFVLNLWIS